MSAEAPQTAPSERVGRYRLLGEIARGGMATVHFARLAAAHGFEKWVAVKLMHEHISQDETFVRMFLDEARIVSQLNHPNICQVQDFGDDDGRLYLVMEYLHGETLSTIVRKAWKDGKRIPNFLAARIMADVARGLHAAHELKDRDGNLVGLVHRDVSPQNIMVLYDGVAKLMDFGVVLAEGRLTETAAGTLKGKFAYMAPEQLRGMESDRRADVWALGVMLWEICCGQRLFRAKGEGQTAVMVLQGDVTDPRALIDGFPDSLAEIIMGCLQRSPDERTGTAREVAIGLERFLMETGTLASPEDVSNFLEERFPGRRAERHAQLRQQAQQDENSTTMSRVREVSGATTQPRKSRGVLIALFLFLMAGVGVALLSLAFSEDADGVTVTELADPPADPPPTREAPAPQQIEPLTVDPPTVEDDPGSSDDPAAADNADEETDIDPPGNTARMTSMRRRPVMRATPMEEVAAAPMMAATMMAAQPQGTGRLNLLSIPSSTVTLGGRRLGRTPLIGHELPAGRHRLVLTTADGTSETVNITIRAGERTARSVSIN